MSDQTGQVTVSSTEDLRKALAAGYTAEQISIDSTPAAGAIQAARAEGEEAGRTAGAAAERTRIAGIHALARRGFEAELKAAIDAGDSPEKFALALLTAAKDRGVTLDAIDRDAPPAAAHAGAPSDETLPASWDAAVTKLGGK